MADSEIHVIIDEVVRDQDIFFIQPGSVPVNDNLVELLLYLDAFRRASAHSVSLVIPYFPYARQDRMAHGREAISARVVANMIEALGAARVIFIDIHNSAIQGFFNIPVDPLSAIHLMAEYFSKPMFSNAAIVSPDVGRAGMAGKYAERLNLPLVVMHKRRTGYSQVVSTHVVGVIAGHRPIIIDDLMAGGSVKQIDMLYNYGAQGKAYFSITHPILLPSALEPNRNRVAQEPISPVAEPEPAPEPVTAQVEPVTQDTAPVASTETPSASDTTPATTPVETTAETPQFGIDINRCTIDDLLKIRGIGHSTAARIIESRNTRGHINSLDELRQIPGIGRKTHRLLTGNQLRKINRLLGVEDVRALLLVGLYQLRHMRVPDHAAVSATVAASVELGKPWARGLTNAVISSRGVYRKPRDLPNSRNSCRTHSS